MADKLKYRIFAEWNRDGKFDKVGTERYDPDKITVVAIHEQEQFINEDGKKKWKPPVKKFEHIFIKDEEPDPIGRDPKIMFDDEDGLYQTEPNVPMAINAIITDPDGNDTIKEIVWLQMMGTACKFDVVPDSNNRSIVIQPTVEGDYAFSCTVTDATDRVATRVANVQVRVQVPVCGPNQHIDPDTGKCVDNTDPEPVPGEKWIPVVAGFGDSNSNTRSSQTFQNINKLQCDVWPFGDYEYDGNFDEFKSIYILREKSKVPLRGNHDHTQSESSAIAAANTAYWGWQDPATGKAKSGHIGLIAIDTQSSASSQKQFVEAALMDFKSDPDIHFIVCGMHKPMICATSKHSEEKEFRDVFQPLFDKYGVDIVTHGHNHNQAVSYPLVTGKVQKFEKNAAGEYDFSKVHGQIYLTSGNSGESLYQIDSNPDYIQWSNDNDYGYMVLERSEQNPKRLRISFMANSGQELFATIIDKTGSAGPEPDQKPILSVEENGHVVGNVNEEVSTSVTAKDPITGNAITDIKWFITQNPDPTLTLNVSEDNWVITFQTAVAGVYIFKAVATGSTGLEAEAELTVTIREVGPEPEPTGNVTLDTRRDTDLHDGKAGTMTKVMHKITGKLLGECRASGNPKIVKNADGTWSLVCDDGHGRVYWYVINFNSLTEIYMKFSPSVDSGTSKVRSLHNEPGDCEQRPGGFGQHMDFDEIGFKTEICHNNHENGKDFDYNPNIQAEKLFGMRYECKNINNDKEVQFTAWLDYMDGQGWKQVAQHKHSSPKQSYMDKTLHANNYLWCPRLNGAGKITVQSLKVIDLDK